MESFVHVKYVNAQAFASAVRKLEKSLAYFHEEEGASGSSAEAYAIDYHANKKTIHIGGQLARADPGEIRVYINDADGTEWEIDVETKGVKSVTLEGGFPHWPKKRTAPRKR